ncbi:hypothetical protein [Dermatophilus congolensis]|uniref:V8-like Glu-specific endopeptidase n=1 Tax=Dermatophilus congolensis TaxID=1863 RepID=A0A239V8W1_9MICO|nr:hypothetical protein [Dermatophilus congolensis]MBO3130537.1 hypothetical protein [Dermatophilus congolensis]MBO3130833.1 hypothetical protein [Dermatophilus congolensis]MBO3135009.1 hypothetical protein [Dermatophilus congolensis]MBO3137248.1 hypothetical protein [Dermatophilus congolensis]MBO3139493.1 hypothetical protein [Dermatophilus congolensis]
MHLRYIAATAAVAFTAAGIVAPVATPAASAAPAAATTLKADRRVPTGALISGTPLSRQATKPGSGRSAGYECTMGLPARKGNQHYLIVSGHCGEYGETLYTAWNNGRRTPIGKITGVSSKYDIAAVRTTRAIAASVWSSRGGSSSVKRLTGVADAVAGSKVCQHGYRSGTVCGITVQPITRKQIDAGLVFGKASAGTVGSRPGDSGGLVVDSRGRAIGIVAESTEDGQWIGWVPAKLALRTWGMSAL